MTSIEDRAKTKAIKALLERDEDFVRTAVQSLVQAALEAEMAEALERGEPRSAGLCMCQASSRRTIAVAAGNGLGL